MRLTFITAFFFIICSSCYYSSSEVFFVDVNTDNLPRVEIFSNLDTIDSPFIKDSIFFEYHITIDTGKVFLTRIYYDDFYIFESDSANGSLWIDPVYIEKDGPYDLDMEVYYKTSTGSLADRIDAEFILKDTSWLITLQRGEIQ